VRSPTIAQVVWSLDIGGAQRAVYQLVRALRTRGLMVDVVVASRAGLYGERLQAEGMPVHELRQRSAVDFAAARRARGLFAEYDIVHFHSADGLLVREAARLPQTELFYTHRAGVFQYPLKRGLKYAAMGRYLRGRFSVSANTQQGARAACALFGIPMEKIRVLYNGIDFSLLEPTRPVEDALRELGSPPDAFRVGTSGNLRDWKRIERLLHAVAALPIHGVVIGDGPERRSLERLANHLGIRDRVTFVGETKDVGDYLQGLDVFVLPSGPEESFGNSAVEAMGVGLPTIVFADGGGLTEHIVDGETGFVVRDQAELVRRVAELALDDKLRAQIGAAAREAVRLRYSMDAMVDRYLELYEAGVGNRGGLTAGVDVARRDPSRAV
jgi:glycosyltransferase involved in cell wall biosynthesis